MKTRGSIPLLKFMDPQSIFYTTMVKFKLLTLPR